jgi:hypothetical protein
MGAIRPLGEHGWFAELRSANGDAVLAGRSAFGAATIR